MKQKHLGVDIEIHEIDNGFMIKLFSENGACDMDKTKFAKNLEQAFYFIKDWHRNLIYKSTIKEVQKIEEIDEG